MAVKSSQFFFILFLALILTLNAAETTRAAVFTVTKIADTNDGTCNGDCSLREAIAAANAAAGDDAISFDGTAFMTPKTITLTGGTPLQINNNGTLTISGFSPFLLTIAGNGQSRIFTINAGANASIWGFTITGGNLTGNGGGIANEGGTLSFNNTHITGNASQSFGGGIYNNGSLTINDSKVIGNLSLSGGGGIFNQAGTVTINNSTIGSNSGGGITNDFGDTLIINNSTISDNSGGGIRNFGSATLTVTNSTISGNSSTNFGGGIENDGTANITNTTITANLANSEGGGIHNDGTVTLENVTVNGNSANLVGGVRNLGTFNAHNSIFGDNIVEFGNAPDFSGTLNSQGYNLIENTSGANITGTTVGNIIGQDPRLGVLTDNEGPTLTCALLVGSPATDAADSNNFPATDQRGTFRPQNGDGIGGARADIGAFEREFTGKPPFDFDGDGKTDLSIFRPSTGEWWYLRSSDGTNLANQFGNSSDKLVPADYTGDGTIDVAVWRPSTNFWYVLRSEDRSFYGFPFGTSGDIPAPGDFDGDGRADPTVFRPSNTTWYIYKSTGGIEARQFGVSGDIPVVADYDGDGKSDIAIFRPSNGQWWIARSTAGTIAFTFGTGTDKPTPGDYTGDGKTDVAFWRPSNGFWFVLRSEDFSFYSFPFGISTDIPAPGDYDGDAMFDAAVFRPSSITWYVRRSTEGVLIQQYGLSGDVPVPSAFIP